MSIDDVRLLIAFVVAVTLLVVLISKYALSPFVSLVIASVVLALSAGLEMSVAWERFAVGVGGILGSTAMVIGLGAMTGMLLHRSGGAAVLAQRLVNWLGVKRLGWAMLFVGLLVGAGVWFTVGLVLLVPVVLSLARVARVSILVPAMSMCAGLSAMHGLLPPHPGPMVAIGLLGADTGRTIMWGLVVGSISAAVSGPLLWRWFNDIIEMPRFDQDDDAASQADDAASQADEGEESTTAPGVLASLTVIALPILLMLLGSFLPSQQQLLALAATGDPTKAWLVGLLKILAALSDPTMAMLVGLLLAYLLLGKLAGFSRRSISKMTEESLFPVANVLLVVGAGAGFSKVLIACGVGNTLAELAQHVPVPPLVLGWLIAAAFRVATGSATTAITAAGGIISVMVADDPTIHREFMVLALGAGSLTLSHVNDGGFWFVKEFFALTVQQTLKTWTVLETVLSLVALFVILILNSFV